MSIRSQILLAVTAISAVTILAFAMVVTARVQARADELAHEAARENARLVAALATRGLEQSKASFDSVVRGLHQTGWLIKLGGSGQESRLQVFDAQAKPRFDSGRVDDDSLPGPDVEAALAGSPLTIPTRLRNSRVAAAEPLRRGTDGQVLGAVRVIRPVVGVHEILASLAPEILALALGCVALAGLFAVVVGRSLSAPISRLTDAARKIAAGERGHSLPRPRGKEVRALTDAYADMRRELEDKREIERLSQDLSHELKNPIASVRALSEALEEGALRDGEVGARLVAQIKRAARRMELVLSDLLALARLEARGLDRRVLVEVPGLVQEALEGLSTQAAERDVSIELGAGSLPPVSGDRVWLVRALGNLLSNALENSPAGSEVTVRGEVRGGMVELLVANPGEIPEAIRSRLFERFVTRRPEGTGLGLAIARSVATAHGGTLMLAESGPPQVVLRLLLPAA